MFDLPADFDINPSSLSIDDIGDIDCAFVSQGDLAAFESQDAYYVLPSGPDPPSIDMLYEHSDNLIAPPTPTVQPNPPLDIDAMMKELLIDDTTFWSFPTPDDQSSYHASTLNDTVFA
ncbi:uncharacterized protein J4E84_007927 [Alternaria hordeiaustralica]|uniref:uncharacterized protein n=1 Tax=Alternaria hordeiaustralica TaxID=1187925 RepID=UPI0020C1C67E|nr:uncharacterized protein J4E84_007927 [Alternaria hordeiaustralica]KAI4680279.1 hypothetical protein J4E84_007927 [Alternaria hordeiaustralica]